MSLTQDHGNHVFECDGKGCHAMLETGTSNFEAARNALTRARWQPFKRGAEWFHHCPDCQRGGQLPLAHGKSRSSNAGAP